MCDESMWRQSAAAYNQLYKECDEIYHRYARARGLSDTALAVLYSLSGQPGPWTQRALCDEWHLPPQTLNSVLKRLEQEGVVQLTTRPEDQRSKHVALTEAGRRLAEGVVAPLVAAEEAVFADLSPEEQAQLLRLTRKYIALLRAAVLGD